VKLCDPLVTNGPYSALEMHRDKVLYKFTLLYFTLLCGWLNACRTHLWFVGDAEWSLCSDGAGHRLAWTVQFFILMKP